MADKLYDPISIEEAMKKIRDEKSKILEAFAKAYLAESGLMPSEVELVCQEDTSNKTLIQHVYFFRRKT